MRCAVGAMRYARRVDANQQDVVDLLRAAGAKVKVIHQPFDLQVWAPNGKTAYFEVKNAKTAYGRKGLNKKQAEEAMGLMLFVVDTPEVALACYMELQK